MAKIPLTIDPEYCATWGAWEGIREFISNAKDAEDEDPAHKMEVQHLPRTSRLVIRTAQTVVDPSALLVLGKSSKRGHDVRGRFGEGFAIGCLALTRAGHEVTFLNGDSKWRCEIVHADEDHPLAGSQLLTFWSRTVSPSEDFEITIEGITTEIWDAMKKLFLFISPPVAAEKVTLPSGSLLLNEKYKGQVFSRGVFVRHFEDLRCGYDLKELELNRDRSMVDEWRLHNVLADLWEEALRHRPDEMKKPIYDLAKAENAPEAYHLRWKTDDRLIKTMKEQFEEEHGQDAVPVSNMAEANEVRDLGGKPQVVNNTLKELLSKAGVSVESAKNQLEGTAARRLNPTDLTEEEWVALKTVEVVCKEYVIVEFRGNKTMVKAIDDGKNLGIDRRLLAKGFREILMHVTQGEARRRGVDATTVLVDAMQSVLSPKKEEPDTVATTPHEDVDAAYPQGDGTTDIPF